MLPRSYRAGARVKKASGSRSPDSSTMSTLRAMQTCPPVQVVLLAPGLPEVIHQVDDPGTQSAKSGIHGPPGYVRLTEPPALSPLPRLSSFRCSLCLRRNCTLHCLWIVLKLIHWRYLRRTGSALNHVEYVTCIGRSSHADGLGANIPTRRGHSPYPCEPACCLMIRTFRPSGSSAGWSRPTCSRPGCSPWRSG